MEKKETTAELIKKLREMTHAGVMDIKKALEENHNNLDKSIQWLREKGIAKAIKNVESIIASDGIVKIITGKNVGIIFELNSQTDFVTKNNLFIDLVNDIGNTLLANVDTIDSISKAKRVKLLKSNLLTIEEACHELSAKFGEKILLRRFIIITAKDKEEFLAFYEHSNKRIGTLLLLKGKEENSIVGKDIAMHVAAMSPKFLDKNDIDKQWLENEMKILTEQTMLEGKPADKAKAIISGRMNKLIAEATLVGQQFVKDQSKTIKQYLKEHNLEVLNFIRFEVGEGIEKKEVDFAKEVANQIENK